MGVVIKLGRVMIKEGRHFQQVEGGGGLECTECSMALACFRGMGLVDVVRPTNTMARLGRGECLVNDSGKFPLRPDGRYPIFSPFGALVFCRWRRRQHPNPTS